VKVVWQVVKATLVGGLLFLVPLILLLMVLGKGIEVAKKVVGPVAKHSPVHSVAGVTIATLAAVAVLLAIAFLVGLFARTSTGRRVKEWLESTILGKVPAYSLLRGMLEPSSLVEGRAKPALAWVEESWVYALVMEEHEDGTRTVFIPGAPSPFSGALYFLPESRVRLLDMTLPAFFKEIRSMGVGSRDLLRGRLAPPAAG
jgi:uncharacterized membrane protein